MKFINVKSYEELSIECARLMLEDLNKANANFCLASGNSPKRAFELFIEEVRKSNTDVSKLYVTKLDEWLGIEKDDACSCEKFIHEAFLNPLGISETQFISMNPACKNVDEEISRINQQLSDYPISTSILGLGMNGHLGLNEPNEQLHVDAFSIELDEKTRTHTMIKDRDITHGMSIGMGQLMASEHIILLVTGSHKQEVVKTLMSKNITTKVPATCLWLHPNVTMIVDESM